MQRFIQIIYSLVLIPIWGLGLLNLSTTNRYSVCIVFLFTVVSIQYVPVLNKRDSLSKFLLLLGPTLYFVMSVIIIKWALIPLSPIVWLYIIVVLLLFVNNNKWLTLAMIVISCLYSFVIYPQINMSTSDRETLSHQDIRTDLNVFDFSFINSQFDTVKLIAQDKSILIETWNESCPPCLKSITDMQDTLRTFLTVDYYYLYQYRGKRDFKLNQIFAYKYFKDNKNILVDINNSLFDSLKLDSYPYFLVFNSQGRLSSFRAGYRTDKKNEIIKELKNMINKSTILAK